MAEEITFDEIPGGILDDEEFFEAFDLPEEWYDRYEGRWYGMYRALVSDNNDPKKWNRIRVECPEIYGAGNTSPWCEPVGLPGSDSYQGFSWVPEIGAVVWVMFEEGDSDYPLYTSGPWFDDTTGLPQHAKGDTDDSDSSSLTPKGKGAGFIPASTAQPQYPNCRVMKSVAGHMLEFDDTPGKERVQLFHKSGAHIEFLQDGSAHLASMKKTKLVAIGDELRLASVDSTAAASGNEVGMGPTGGTYGPKGWLGQKSSSTEPIVCGSILVQYLQAIHTALATLGTPTITAELSAAGCPGLGSALTALLTTLTTLATTYFTPGATSFLSDLWYTAKTVTGPEA